jgi:hypothetical protein
LIHDCRNWPRGGPQSRRWSPDEFREDFQYPVSDFDALSWDWGNILVLTNGRFRILVLSQNLLRNPRNSQPWNRRDENVGILVRHWKSHADDNVGSLRMWSKARDNQMPF